MKIPNKLTIYSGIRSDPEMENYRLAGNFTVEAALIFSILLLLLADILLMTEYQSDVVRMTALLGEKAVAQAGRDTDQGDPPERGGFFRLHDGSIRLQISGSSVVASCHDIPENSRYGEEYQASFRVKKRKPVTWIRRIRLVQALAD